MRNVKGILFLLVILFAASSVAAPPPAELPIISKPVLIDNMAYINANRIFMFVTNHGNYGRDLSGFFGRDYGTYFPYTDIVSIQNGSNVSSPLYAGGLWIGAIDSATGQIRICLSEYSSEYVPGPMSGGTFLPDSPEFRVYKLYRDSLAANPNSDYLNWPVSQGAPTTTTGTPALFGDQMLWTVYNDANPAQHYNNSGETMPLGVEIHQSIWASSLAGNDTLYLPTQIPVVQQGTAPIRVEVFVVDPHSILEHDYRIVVDSAPGPGRYWQLIDVTLGDFILATETNFSGDDNYPVIHGMLVKVIDTRTAFSNFEVVANASGSLISPEGGAFDFAGFPSVPITPDQQVGNGSWGIHAIDAGNGTCGGSIYSDYNAFLSRVTRGGANNLNIGSYDYEIRFTGSISNPGVNGSYAIEFFNDDNVFWVPFEVWRIGNDTPNDPSDDVRLVLEIYDDGNDNTFNLESWGCALDPVPSRFNGYGEHSVSGDINDPFTDGVYFRLPIDSTPGQDGYLANLQAMQNDTYDRGLTAYEILARVVLVNWNGHLKDSDTLTIPPQFNQNMLEEGTIFRISTYKGVPRDTFNFRSTIPPVLLSSAESQSAYIRYKIYNKGSNVLQNCYIAFWSDPDLGGAGDDFVGCDTANNLFYCYNGDNSDAQYYGIPPAIGFKVLYGPLVASAMSMGFFDGHWIDNHSNLGLTGFSRYINGTDPDYAQETYNYMRGLNRDGSVYIDTSRGMPSSYMVSGNPLTGIGDLDALPADRRMMGSCGPIRLAPGDSQFVLIKMAVGQGTDRLSSITKLKYILNAPYNYPTDVGSEQPGLLPTDFYLAQNFPNPFNAVTVINYSLPRRATVFVDIFNILGQKVKTLVQGEKPAGYHSVLWDGKNEAGKEVGSGIYFYRLKAGQFTQSKKMLLLK